MVWTGWYDADPLVVAMDDGGQVDMRLQGKTVARVTLSLVQEEANAGPGHLLQLPGSQTAPSPVPWSWVNERGRGQIVVVESGRVLVCQLRGRLPAQESTHKGETAGSGKHPLAGFWLSLAMSVHAPRSMASLVWLSGYSYPTVHEWVRRESLGGRITIHHQGRSQILMPTEHSAAVWWSTIKQWWPTWRSPSWPKRHGPVAVHWGRAPGRLPSLVLGKSRADQRWGISPEADGWLWATGADFLTAQGVLIQSHDSDVWISRSAWQCLKKGIVPVRPPATADLWPATRFTVMDDDHALLRMAWFIAGAEHPAWGTDGQARLMNCQRQEGLLAGLPLLDALHHPDARVAERGHAQLDQFEQQQRLR